MIGKQFQYFANNLRYPRLSVTILWYYTSETISLALMLGLPLPFPWSIFVRPFLKSTHHCLTFPSLITVGSYTRHNPQWLSAADYYFAQKNLIQLAEATVIVDIVLCMYRLASDYRIKKMLQLRRLICIIKSGLRNANIEISPNVPYILNKPRNVHRLKTILDEEKACESSKNDTSGLISF